MADETLPTASARRTRPAPWNTPLTTLLSASRRASGSPRPARGSTVPPHLRDVQPGLQRVGALLHDVQPGL